MTHVTVQDQDSAPQQSDLLLRLPEMNACFNKDSVEDVYTALKELDTEWGQATLKLLNGYVFNVCRTLCTPVKCCSNSNFQGLAPVCPSLFSKRYCISPEAKMLWLVVMYTVSKYMTRKGKSAELAAWAPSPKLNDGFCLSFQRSLLQPKSLSGQG